MEETITELETAKMSVQNLLADNLCLKAEARGLKEEACRNLEQERAKFGAEVGNLQSISTLKGAPFNGTKLEASDAQLM